MFLNIKSKEEEKICEYMYNVYFMNIIKVTLKGLDNKLRDKKNIFIKETF